MPGVGGGEADPVLAELAMLRGAGSAVVLVHGGGPEIDSALARLGISTSRIDGLRVTDAATLEITEAVLCASINKRIVRDALALRHAGRRAERSGRQHAGRRARDGSARRRPWLRRTHRLNRRSPASTRCWTRVSCRSLRRSPSRVADRMPTMSTPIWRRPRWRAHCEPTFSLRSRTCRASLPIPTIPRSGIDAFTPEDAFRFAAGEACRSSMKPKLQAAARAVRDGAGAAYICSAKPNAIAAAIRGEATVIRSDDSVSHRAKVQPRIVIWHPAR